MKQLSLLIILLLLLGFTLKEDKQKYNEDKQNTQNAVSDWIKKHSLYPDSYKPISFSDFSQSHSVSGNEKIPGSESYIIKHIHKILNKDSVLTTFKGYFTLESNFDVNIIEIEKSNSIAGVFPPQIQVWTSKFGRPMNAQDSLEFEKKSNEMQAKLLKELEDGVIIGEFQLGDSDKLDNMEDMMKLIDSLESNK